MSSVWALSLLEIDPNLVAPGWTPLVVTLLLGGALVLLFFSMRRQFRRIHLPGEDDQAGPPEVDIKTTPPRSGS